MMDIDINTDTLRGIASFLAQNEQCGNDWTEELAELYKVIEYIDAKNGKFSFPSYEDILSTCLEDMSEDDAYVVHLPLGYHVEFIHDSLAWIIWAVFYDKDDKPISQEIFWNDGSKDGADRRNFEYYLDHFFDKLM